MSLFKPAAPRTAQEPIIQIRRLTHQYVDAVLAIDRRTSGRPWKRPDFTAVANHQGATGVVAICTRSAACTGFLVYEMGPQVVLVHRLAVALDYRRKRIGTGLLAFAMIQVGDQRERATIQVGDDNLDAHLFLRACSWRATGVNRDDRRFGRDSYTFIWQFRDL